MRFRSRQQAQSVVEFGILALLFALMMFAIVEFGLLLNGWVSVSSNTREAARWASTGLRVAGSPGVDGIYEKVAHGQTPAGVAHTDQQVEVRFETTPDPWICTATVLTPPYPDCTHGTGPTQAPTLLPSATTVPIGTQLTVTVRVGHYEVITPLIRPIFGCGGAIVHCYVPIYSWNSMYYEGPR